MFPEVPRCHTGAGEVEHVQVEIDGVLHVPLHETIVCIAHQP